MVKGLFEFSWLRLEEMVIGKLVGWGVMKATSFKAIKWV
jgi:hypothetical protein